MSKAGSDSEITWVLETISVFFGSAPALENTYKRQIIFVPKSREMMISWAVIGFATWFCQMFSRVQVIVHAQKLDKACELVRGMEPPGYARTLYERQDEWLNRRFPLAKRMEDLPADNRSSQNASPGSVASVRSNSRNSPTFDSSNRRLVRQLIPEPFRKKARTSKPIRIGYAFLQIGGFS